MSSRSAGSSAAAVQREFHEASVTRLERQCSRCQDASGLLRISFPSSQISQTSFQHGSMLLILQRWKPQVLKAWAQGCMISLPRHSVSQEKSQVQPSFKGRRNKFLLLIEGATYISREGRILCSLGMGWECQRNQQSGRRAWSKREGGRLDSSKPLGHCKQLLSASKNKNCCFTFSSQLSFRHLVWLILTQNHTKKRKLETALA